MFVGHIDPFLPSAGFQMKRFEGLGMSREQAEALTHHLTNVVCQVSCLDRWRLVAVMPSCAAAVLVWCVPCLPCQPVQNQDCLSRLSCQSAMQRWERLSRLL